MSDKKTSTIPSHLHLWQIWFHLGSATKRIVINQITGHHQHACENRKGVDNKLLSCIPPPKWEGVKGFISTKFSLKEQTKTFPNRFELLKNKCGLSQSKNR